MTVENKLEKLLEVGTWASTFMVGVGVLFSITHITNLGIGMFILIPIIRVFGLIINFHIKKDLKMFWIAATVFSIIVVSLIVGIWEKIS